MIVWFFGWLVSFGALAAPPIATLDRSPWPEALTSPALFDVASRAEILTFAKALLASEVLDESGLKQRLGLTQIDLDSIDRLRHRLWQRLLSNYQRAQKSCEQDASFCYFVEDMHSLREAVQKFQLDEDSFYWHWAEPSRLFHEDYLDELLRMAALFPQSSNEMVRFGEHERDGDELNDRVFLLTFDGGPTATTDGLIDYLRQQKLRAAFFVLGNDLQARLDSSSAGAVQALFKHQCVGLLGWQYRSHRYWQDWEGSILRSKALVRSVLPENYLPMFRPPYGQRRADSGEFFQAQGLQVALWNIDAQDATGKLSADQVAQRVLTLMLLWRHGVIAFHDIQNKASTVLPWLLKSTAQSGLGWQDCQDGF